MKRRRVWLWLLGALGVAGAVAALIVGDAHRRSDAVIERHRREALQLIDAYRAKPAPRPPFEGPAREGNAWEVYRRALSPLISVGPDEEEQIQEMTTAGEPDDEVVGVLLLRYAPVVEGIDEALRCSTADPQYRYEDGAGMDMSSLLAMKTASRILAAGAGHARRMKNGAALVNYLTWGLGLAQDMSRRAGLLGMAFQASEEGRHLAPMAEVFREFTFGETELAVLARRLDALEGSRTTLAEAWVVEEIPLRSTVSLGAVSPEQRNVWDHVRPSWRDLFSFRISQARALAEVSGILQDWRSFASLAPHLRVLKASIPRQVRPHPYLEEYGHMMRQATWMDVECLRDRALLRMAVALTRFQVERKSFPSTLEELVPRYLEAVPSCPYSGKPFGYADGRVWSVGSDGVDDPGLGLPLEDPSPNPEADDVVWVVKRRK